MPQRAADVLERQQLGFERVLCRSQMAAPLSGYALKAREALVRSAPSCRASEPPAPYLRDWVRLVRIPHRLHEQGQRPLGHISLDATSDGEPPCSEAMDSLALEQLAGGG